jgi:aminodeoxyfutalosine deaminase
VASESRAAARRRAPLSPPDPPDDLLGSRLARLPKAELHVHLEGTADRGGLAAILAARGEPEPADLARLFHHAGFAEFLDHFRSIVDLLRRPADYGLLAGRYLDLASRHGLRHVEFTLSLGSAVRRGLEPRAVLEAIRGATDERPGGARATVVVDCVRQFGPEAAAQALEAALPHRDLALVVGFGMGGDEGSLPAAAFRRVYDRARHEGLRTTVHAGEAAGPESVEEALEQLRPDRIAHGISAASRPGLLERLARRRITLDICLTSNVRTGVVPRLEEHPLPRILQAGVPVTLGTDDPGLFETDLSREYRLAAGLPGVEEPVLEAVAAHSLEAAFPLP